MNGLRSFLLYLLECKNEKNNQLSDIQINFGK